MRQERLAAAQRKCAERKVWVTERLSETGHSVRDAGSICDISPRTWRDWVTRGSLPVSKQPDVVFALFGEEDITQEKMLKRFEEISQHFTWIE